MNNSSWINPWNAGAQLSHYLFFLQLNPEKNKDKINNILNRLNEYKKHNGWYFGNPPPHNVRINGIMKIFTGLDIINHDYNTNKGLLIKIVDEMLNLNPSSGGCNLYDFVYVLCKSIDINYRIEECKTKLIQIGNILLKYQHPDGGFSFNIHGTTKGIYGKSCSLEKNKEEYMEQL